MAKKKRRRRLEYVDYEHAMRDVEKLASEDKVDSEEYEAAIEAATQFFLRSNGAYRFNQELESAGESHQEKVWHKWPTVKALAEKIGLIWGD